MRTRFAPTIVGTVLVVIVAGCAASPGQQSTDSPASPGSAAPSSAEVPAGFPIGTWTTTITEDDLVAAGVRGGEIGENAGVFTTTLAEDGTWTTAQESDVTLRWPVFRGTWTVTGPDTFSQRTDFPSDFAGDVVTFRWEIVDGNLVLDVLDPPDHILPIVTETHPWTPAG